MMKALIPALAAAWALTAVPASAEWNLKRVPVSDRDEDRHYYSDDHSSYDDDYDDDDDYYDSHPSYYYGNSYSSRRYRRRIPYWRYEGRGSYPERPTRGGMSPNK